MSENQTHAKCPECEQVMDPGNGCTVLAYKWPTEEENIFNAIPRIPYGQESRFIEIDPEYSKTRTICHDCNVAPGQLHHPGCDMEECAKCHGQSISCDCK